MFHNLIFFAAIIYNIVHLFYTALRLHADNPVLQFSEFTLLSIDGQPVQYSTLRRGLFLLPPEIAHHLTLSVLSALYGIGLLRFFAEPPPSLPVTVMGLTFTNPVGLAAGLDKDAKYLWPLSALGFGFLEAGTVTPQPQPGNPQPRLFRIAAEEALINRMGFNSDGIDAVVKRLQNRPQTVVGANLGVGRGLSAAQAAPLYAESVAKVYLHADYIALNLSSPNTPGLRKLQHLDAAEQLLERVLRRRERLIGETGIIRPLALKLSADLSDELLTKLAVLMHRMGAAAVIATNTSTARPIDKQLRHAGETGGLSGRPLAPRALEATRVLVAATGGKLPVIASGGVYDATAAAERIAAGAALVQLYTGLIYRGTALISDTVKRIRDAAY